MDGDLRTLIDLQGLDTKIAALEGELARLPKEIEAIHAAVARARQSVEGLKGRLDQTRKDIRSKEKDLEVCQAKRQKSEARLYEVKTNKEYSAVLVEIEEIKQEKARTEEEILALMEVQERLVVEVREAEAALRAREAQGEREEARVRERLGAAEVEVAALQSERAQVARELPEGLLADYAKLLRHRAGLAVAPVGSAGICGGCRVGLTPQRLQEVKQRLALITCESCGRFLYWSPPEG
jgi:predicted  nucleic acid-binding Zn-ribbon protein